MGGCGLAGLARASVIDGLDPKLHLCALAQVHHRKLCVFTREVVDWRPVPAFLLLLNNVACGVKYEYKKILYIL